MLQVLDTGATLRQGTYRIEKVLGQGGFGITYLATDLNLDKLVAIKEFFPRTYCYRESSTSHVVMGTENTHEFVERLRAKFLKEARNIAKFDHPGIIKILTAFEEHNTAYYVMDYIEGTTLEGLVKTNGPLPADVAIGYITKVGDALEYVHYMQINHLDVKPANIMVRGSDLMPILIDFGLSKQYDNEGHQTSTTITGISHGFAPIEQYKECGLQQFSPQTDLYGLAATLYYLLTATVPPQAIDLTENGLQFPPNFPPYLIEPLRKAMATSRAQRHATVREFISHINHAQAAYSQSYSRKQPQGGAPSHATIINPTPLSGATVPVQPNQPNQGGYINGPHSNIPPNIPPTPPTRPIGPNQPLGDSAPFMKDPAPQKPASSKKGLIAAAAVVGAIIIGVVVWNLLSTPEPVRFSSIDDDDEELVEPVEEVVEVAEEAAIDSLAPAAGYWEDEEMSSIDCNEKGAAFFNDEEYSSAVYWFNKAAQMGNSTAQYNLGYCYENGYGTSTDYAAAAHWYRKSAEQGDPDAQYRLGYCYEHGLGVSCDADLANYWYGKANAQAAPAE